MNVRIVISSFLFALLSCMTYSAEVVSSSISNDRNISKSKVLFDEINSMIQSAPPEQRDYSSILKKAASLASLFPESEGNFFMLETIRRWRTIGLISHEQYQPFEKRLSEYVVSESNGQAFFESIGKQYQKYLSSPDSNKYLLDGISNSCHDVLDSSSSTDRMKCFALLWLARISLENKDYAKSEEYLRVLLENQNLAEQDFADSQILLMEVNHLKASSLLKQKGLNAAIDFWEKYINDNADSMEKVSHAYEQIFLLLDEGIDDSNTTAKINLLEEFIKTYPEDKSESLLQARLTLGYILLNNQTSLSGVVTMEEAKSHAEKYKANADNAEKLFRESLLLSRGTPFERTFNEALVVVSEAQGLEYPQASSEIDKEFLSKARMFSSKKTAFLFVVFINIILVLLVVYVQRKQVMRFIMSFFSKN